MKKFGFIFHPLDIGLFADGFSEKDIKKKRVDLIDRIMIWFPPFKRSTVTGIRSLATGEKIEGEMILAPFLPKHILAEDSNFVLDRFIQAGKLAEDLGCRIVGLGAYAAQVGKKGILISKNLKIPVTTGSSYTISIAVESILKVAGKINLKLSEAEISVIGATGAIGDIFSKMMASFGLRKLNLVARHEEKLKILEEEILKFYNSRTKIELDINEAIKNADIVITATSTPSAIIDARMLKPGAIVCDISRPRNVSEDTLRLRPDILIIEGGIVKPPGNTDFHFSFGLPQGLAYACMAETMILTLEGMFENYSIGGNLSLEKVNEITKLGIKHGFKLAEFRSFDKDISRKDIEKIKEIRCKKEKL